MLRAVTTRSDLCCSIGAVWRLLWWRGKRSSLNKEAVSFSDEYVQWGREKTTWFSWWWDLVGWGCLRSCCAWQLNHSEINRLIFISRTMRLQGNMSFRRMRIEIPATVRTSDVVFENRTIAMKESWTELPEGTSLGRNAGKGPPCCMACVTERASRIVWINERCFSLHVDFDRILD